MKKSSKSISPIVADDPSEGLSTLGSKQNVNYKSMNLTKLGGAISDNKKEIAALLK